MNHATLHILTGKSRGTRVAISSALTLGSRPGVGLMLDDPGIAPEQARFEVRSGAVYVSDLSGNGSTKVAGAAIGGEWRRLSYGAQVAFGSVLGRLEAATLDDADDPLGDLTLGLSDSDLDFFADEHDRKKTWAIEIFPDAGQSVGTPADFQQRRTEVMQVPDEAAWDAGPARTPGADVSWPPIPSPPSAAPATEHDFTSPEDDDEMGTTQPLPRLPEAATALPFVPQKVPPSARQQAKPAPLARPQPTPPPARPQPSPAPPRPQPTVVRPASATRRPSSARGSQRAAPPSTPKLPPPCRPSARTAAPSPAPASEARALQALQAHGYTMQRELSRSQTGILLDALQLRLERPVLVRVLPPAIATDARAARRLRSELARLARLEDPHIVPIYDLFEAEGSVFLVTGHGSGQTVRSLLDERAPLPPEEALQLIREALLGLHCAAEVEVVHRDLRPSRLHVDRCHRVRIGDFGLASAAADALGPSGQGWVLGTPAYMAPELCREHTADHRSDLYSLGVIVFEMLSGQPPFLGPSPEETFAMHQSAPVPSLRRLVGGIGAEVEALVGRLLEKQPQRRFQTAIEVVTAIENLAFKPAGVVHSQALRPAARPSPAPTATTAAAEPKAARRFLVESDLLVLAAVLSLRLLSLERMIELADASPSDEEPNLLRRLEDAQLLNKTQFGKIERLVEISTILRRDGFYAKAALENELADRAQLNKAIAIQARKTPLMRIGRFLHSMGVLTRRQDKAIENVQRRVSAKIDSVLASKAEAALFAADGDKAERSKQLSAAIRPLVRWMEKTTVPRLKKSGRKG